MGLKNVLSVLICLSVISLNSRATTSAKLNQLIDQSQIEAQSIIAQKIRSNDKLISEIADIEKQIAGLKADISINRKDTKRNLYIAAGSVVGTFIALKYFGRGTGSEVADSIRILLGIFSAYTGVGITVISLGAGGVNYFLVQVDEKNLTTLEQRLAELKQQLITQNEKLAN